ncbi:hypothetical protein L1987_02822 [Smallanthus sonchifolius]|uniref:Uncharacterized protein n=1 Tax=Smallanthus sonchifolius TaxID=185202 RepID=A0ACB9K918_9ASTR|nr:hypothetical protein L1987_02822 [Smallanthus sonchifolius]
MLNLTKDKGKAPMYENITGDDDPPSAGFHCGSSSILSEQFVRMNLIDASNRFCGEDQQGRGALPKTVYGLANMYTSDNSDMSAKRNDVLDLVTQCMDRLRGCSNSKSAVIRELVGDVNHSDVPFTAPRGIKNKGSGTKRRRFIGPGERASVTRKKPGRKCRKCLGIGDHDSRNCPLNEDVESP